MIIALTCYLALAAVAWYFIHRAFKAERKFAQAMNVIVQLDTEATSLSGDLQEREDHLANANSLLDETRSERDAYFRLATELYESFEDQSGGDASMITRIKRRGKALQEARILLGRSTPVKPLNGSAN